MVDDVAELDTESPAAERAVETPADRRAATVELAMFALLAGFLVRVGSRVFALRERGETIDDGEQYLEALEDGLYERLERYVEPPGDPLPGCWILSYQGSSPRPPLRRAMTELSDAQVEALRLEFVVARGLTKLPAYARALRTGMRLADPPSTIIG